MVLAASRPRPRRWAVGSDKASETSLVPPRTNDRSRSRQVPAKKFCRFGPRNCRGHPVSARTASTSASAAVLVGRAHQRRPKAVAHDRGDLLASEPQRLRHGEVVLVHVAAEIGRVVGIDRHLEALVHHPAQRMMGEIIDHAQPQIGERAHGQRHLLVREPAHQDLILERAVAVIDAPDAEQVERFPDVARRPLLAGMRAKKEALVAGAGEHALELARRVPGFGRIETDADDPVLERQRAIERPFGIRLLEMAQEAHDQPGVDAELLRGVDRGAVETRDHGRERDAARRMPLRVEEHLDVADIVGVRAFQVRPGQIVEILLRDQHRHALIVEVEKILQVAEPVGLAQRLDRRIGQADAVAARQREHELRLQAAFDVNVQFALGQSFDERGEIVHPVAYPALTRSGRGSVPSAPVGWVEPTARASCGPAGSAHPTDVASRWRQPNQPSERHNTLSLALVAVRCLRRGAAFHRDWRVLDVRDHESVRYSFLDRAEHIGVFRRDQQAHRAPVLRS